MSVKSVYILTLERDERPRLLFVGPGIDNDIAGHLVESLLELATAAMDKVGGLVLTAKVARSKFSVLVSGANMVLAAADVPLDKGRDVNAEITVAKAPFRLWLQSVGYGPMDEDRVRLWLQDCLVEVIADNARSEPVSTQAPPPECDCDNCPDRDLCEEFNTKPTVN